MGSTTGFLLPVQLLKDYGCRSCVWKQYGQCVKGYTEDGEGEVDGYCQEFADFLFSLYSDGDGVSAVKEKYLLYTQELASQSDGKEFRSLLRKYKDLREQGVPERDLGELKIAIEGYKIWWHRLTESVAKGLSKVSDRERRSKDSDKTREQLSVHDINKLLAHSARVLLDNNVDSVSKIEFGSEVKAESKSEENIKGDGKNGN